MMNHPQAREPGEPTARLSPNVKPSAPNWASGITLFHPKLKAQNLGTHWCESYSSKVGTLFWQARAEGKMSSSWTQNVNLPSFCLLLHLDPPADWMMLNYNENRASPLSPPSQIPAIFKNTLTDTLRTANCSNQMPNHLGFPSSRRKMGSVPTKSLKIK